MGVVIPKQSVPFSDGVVDDKNNPALFDKTWWLAFNSAFDVLNTLSSAHSVDLPFVTAEQFGAVGNGTTDDTSAVQAAFNDGRAVILKRNSQYACSALLLPSDLTVFGLPGATIIQAKGAAINNAPFIRNLDQSGGNSNIQLWGVTFDGNSANQGMTTGVNIIDLRNVSSIKFCDCQLQNALARCLYGFGLSEIDILDCGAVNWATGNVGAIHLESDGNGASSGIRIRGGFYDGRASSSSCIKLSGDLAHTISSIEVIGVECRTGNTTDSVLCIELFAPQLNAGGYHDFVISGCRVFGGPNPATDQTFGVSIGGSGGLNGSVTGCVMTNCGVTCLELSGSYLTAANNMSWQSGNCSVDASFGPCVAVKVIGNTFFHPAVDKGNGLYEAIHIVTRRGDGVHDYDITDLGVIDNWIYSANDHGRWISFQNLNAGSMIRPWVVGNHIIGAGFADEFGITVEVGVGGGTVQHLTVDNNWFDNLANGISQGGTNGRYNFNRFTNVTTHYSNAFDPTDIVNESDSSKPFWVTQLRTIGMSQDVLPANGDVVNPQETTSFVSGSNAPSNPNVYYHNGVNFGTELQGNIRSVNSRWTGAGNWLKNPSSGYARALYIVEGAGRWGIMFGAATNALGANPGTLLFWIDDPLSSSVTPGINYGAGIIYSGGYGLLGAPSDLVIGAGGTFPHAASLAFGNATGWSLDFITNVSGSPHILASLTDTGNFATGWIGAGVSSPSAGTTSLDALETQVSKLGVGGAPDHAGSTLAKIYGDAEITGVLKNDSLTVSRPVITDASKNLVSVKIDLSSANLVQGSGLASGQALVWNGTSVSGVSGLASGTVSEIPGGTPAPVTVITSVTLGGTVPPGLTLSTTTDTASKDFSVNQHTVTEGIVG